jgi:hypothetical protein
MLDVWQNQFRILRGTNASSDGLVAQWNLHSKQVQFPAYTGSGAFTGTAVANLAVDSAGNILTVATGGGGGSAFPFTGSAQITGSLGVTGSISASGAFISLANGAMYFRGGDDAELWDINVANTLGVYGQQNQDRAGIKLGSAGPTLFGSGSNLGINMITPTGSTLTVNGNVWATSFTGSLLGTATTASYVLNAVSASFATNAATATSASYAQFANTASSADNFTVRGTLTAQTIVAQTITSSTVFSSGSNRFGNDLTNTQTFTGSLLVTGSNHTIFGNVGIGTTSPLARIHEVSNGLTNLILEETGAGNAAQMLFKNTARTWDVGADSSPDGFYIHLQNGNQDYFFINPSGSIGIGKNSPNARLDVSGSTVITGSLTVVTGSGIEFQVTNTGVRIGNAITDIHTVTGSLSISGSTTAAALRGSGSAVFSIDGTAGRLFQVDDSLTGSLFSVNTAGGLPIIEAFSDNTVRIGQFGQQALFVSQSRVGVGIEVPTAKLHISSSTGAVLQTVSGSTVGLFVSSSGNVGIGTTNPSTPLSFGPAVGNKIALYDAGAGTTIYGFGIQSSLLQIFANTITDRVGIGYGNSTSFTETLTVRGANVGIGTTSPTKRFTVRSTTNDTTTFAGFYAENLTQGVELWYGGIQMAGSSTNVSLNLASKGAESITFNTSGSERMRITSGGNVGIGMTTPTGSTLTVNGNVWATSFTGSLLGTATTASFVLNAVSASFATSAATATSSSFATNAISASYAQFANTASSADNFTVRGTLTAQTLVVQTITSSIIFSSGSNRFGNDLTNTQTFTGSILATGSSHVIYGNVGLGDPSPSDMLVVNGRARINGTNRLAFGNSSGGYAQIGVSGATTGNLIFLNFDGSTTNENMRITTDGKVGIGTTAPVYKLEVNNSTEDNHIAAIGSAPSIQFASANTNPVSWGTIGMATTTNNFIIGAIAGDLAIVNRGSVSGSIIFGMGSTSNSEKMRITPVGNVGIGTATPTLATLQVNGNVFATSFTGSFSGSFAGSITNATSASYAATASVVLGSVVSASYALTSSYAFNASNAVSASYAQQANTASSADNFTVRGTLTAQTIIAQVITSSTVFSSGSNRFGNDLTNTQTFTGSLLVTGSNHTIFGNVGIGTAGSGTFRLDVSGSARMQGVTTITPTNTNTSIVLGNTANNADRIIDATGYVGNRAAYRFININGGVTVELCANNLTYVHSISCGSQGNTGLILTGATGTAAAGSSVLDIRSTTQGILFPRMTAAQRTAIPGPASGLLVYDTGSASTEGVWVYETTGWQQLLTNTGSQSISGSLTLIGNEIITGSSTATLGYTGSLLGTATTASYVLNAVSASFATSAATATTASYVLNAVSASFATNAASASYAVTSSFSRNFTVGSTLVIDQALIDYASVAASSVGSNNLFTQNTGSYTSAFFKYTCASASFASRAGEVVAVWNGTSVQFYDNSTVDIGNTTPVTSSVAIVSGQVQFNMQTNTSGWTIKSMATFI